VKMTPPFVPVPLFGGGTTRFEPVFAGDVAAAIRRIVDDPATAGRAYELGGPEVMTLRRIMELVLKETNRRRFLVPVPLFVARAQGAILQFFPGKLLTLDQARMLETDTVVSANSEGLAQLGIAPTPAETILPTYLWRFRPHGQFEQGAETLRSEI